MKKLVLLSFLLIIYLNFGQNFDSFASAVKINNTIYNTTGSGINLINPNPGAPLFDGVNLGVFGQNSSCARITGGEIKTWKTATGNVCSANLYWRVYPSSSAPTGGFNPITLTTISNCDTANGVFFDGLGPCASNDQKWKDYTINVDFISSLTPGNYILEIYYDFTGSDVSSSTCEATKFINNSSSNFKGNFTISNPTCSPTVSPTTVCEGSTIQLTANPVGGIAPYTYSWTGPIGFTSNVENPTLITSLSSGGVYSLTVTDSCGATSSNQSTNSVTITPKVDPEFEGLNPELCRFGTPPLLPNLSSNGITGTWNPATVDNSVTGVFSYTFTPDAGQCALQTTLDVIVNPNITPTFDPIPNICYQTVVPTLPSTSTNGISGTWNPATISNTASGTYTFTPTPGLCALTTTINITVDIINPLFDVIAPICEGGTVPSLPLISTNGITGTWNPATVSNTTSGIYTFTPDANQCATTTNLNVTITPNITPTFNPIAPICENSTSPILPLTSNNGITGTWNPATVSNTTSGDYIFTPTTGQCATNFTLTVTVNPNITPTFNSIDAICEGTTTPTLSTISNNGITGTWNPSTISNTTSGTYTFTPNVGQCALQTTLDVIVNPNITPIFDSISPICSGATAPVLPLVSNNGISGTWNPSTINNTASGTYIFTPNTGQCATTASLTINVNSITPIFDTIAAICENGTTPILPLTSTNGIIGTWNPSIISSTTSGTYIFTPDAGQCAISTSLNVVVNPNVTPIFDVNTTVCFNGTAPILPLLSNNGISGTWNPATISNTISGTYTFTPDSGQCATTTSISITVNSITPTFATIAPLCENGIVPTLPLTSTNGISGTWSPSTVSNTSSGTYTFTPNAGQCATLTTLNIVVNPNNIPTFNAITPICQNSSVPTLPLTSTNGISGTWNPATISNTASGTYTFTPNAGQCATSTTLSITVTPNTIPTFSSIAPICYNTTAPILPITSNNGITGVWNSTVSNTSSGTYTFTPNAGQCATTATLSVTVNASPTDIDLSISNVFNETPQGSITINGITNGNGPFSYSLNGSTFSSSTIYDNLSQGDYTITVKDSNGCTFEKMVSISSNCLFPKGISANGDGMNDTFNLSGCNVKKLEIFNRYGTKVNSFENYSDQWTGIASNGNELPDGTYFYVAEIANGTTKTGWVYIIK